MTAGPLVGKPLASRTAPARRRAHVVLRAGTWLSLRLDRRVLVVWILAGLLALFAMVFTLATGPVHVPLPEVLRAITGGGNHFDHLIVHVLREPRVLTALFVGACLGMSGAIFQNLAGNALVSPDIIGINAGAHVAMVALVVVVHEPVQPDVVRLVGSLAAVLLVFALWFGAGLSPYRLVLVGVAVNTALGAVTTYLVSSYMRVANTDQVTKLNLSLLGGFAGVDWSTVEHLVTPALVLLCAGTALGRQLELFQLGEPVAIGLGGSVNLARLALLGVGAGLAAISVAAAGPVGFVAFIAPHIAPHIARRSARYSGNGILPLSAAVGAALVVVADYVAQRAFEPFELPVGIVTSLIGGPYFLFLLLLLRSAKAYAL